jgi:hypothetical protein
VLGGGNTICGSKSSTQRLTGIPTTLRWIGIPSFASPAASRYSASSPGLLKRLHKWNADKPYAEQIKPFGFLLVYTDKTGVFALPVDDDEDWSEVDVGPGRPANDDEPRPIAPFDTDLVKALAGAFDRVTGEPVKPEQLRTSAEMLSLSITLAQRADSRTDSF